MERKLFTEEQIVTIQRAVCAVGLFLRLASPISAQESAYLPSHRLAEGRQIVAVYIGASNCVPCALPDVKAAIRAMKPLLAAQSKQYGASFAVIGAAQDFDLKKASEFLEPLGAFDQVVLGGSWLNLATEQFVLRDANALVAMPQVIVLERSVTLWGRVGTSRQRVLRRIAGEVAIPAWVNAGAKIGTKVARQRR